MDNKKLAKFITGLGRFDNYGSTVAQTEKALEENCTSHLNQENDDVVIFTGCLKAINKVLEKEFCVDSIVLINAQFDGKSDAQPKNPGRLRDGLKYPEDKIRVPLWPGEDGQVYHYPPLQVDEGDLQKIVDEWEQSEKFAADAWKLFAKLACLQPFQDGNKRTALIAANHALGTLRTQDYILPPIGRKFTSFMGDLMEYYHNSADLIGNDSLHYFAIGAVS